MERIKLYLIQHRKFVGLALLLGIMPTAMVLLFVLFPYRTEHSEVDIKNFAEEARNAGVCADIVVDFGLHCKLTLHSASDLDRIPSTKIPIPVILHWINGPINANEVKKLRNITGLSKLMLERSPVSYLTLDEIAKLKLSELELIECHLSGEPDRSRMQIPLSYRLKVEECSSELAECTLENFQFPCHLVLRMPLDFKLKLERLDLTESLSIHGCDVSSTNTLQESNNLFTAAFADSSIDGETVGRILSCQNIMHVVFSTDAIKSIDRNCFPRSIKNDISTETHKLYFELFKSNLPSHVTVNGVPGERL